MSAVLLVSTLIDIYASWIGDALEAQRHLVGPLLRLTLMIIVSVAIGADSAWARLRSRPPAAEVHAPIEAPDNPQVWVDDEFDYEGADPGR